MEHLTNFAPLEPSELVAEYFAFLTTLEPIKELPVGKSLALPKAGLQTVPFADLVAQLNVDGKRFAVIEHPSVFEVTRFPDKTDLSFFYKFVKSRESEKVPTFESNQVICVRKAVKDYILAPWVSLQSYCVGLPQELHSARIVPYAYLQRKLSCVAVFRKDRRGPNVALKSAIEVLKSERGLVPIEKKTLMDKFKCGSSCFAIENLESFDF